MADIPADRQPTGDGTVRLARRRQITTEVALLFVVLSILALGLVPFINRERFATIEGHVRDVLENEARRRFLETMSMYERQSASGQSAPGNATVSGLGVTVAVDPARM